MAWTTDVPSTSQVLLTDLTTGVQTATGMDMTMTTQHKMFVDNMSDGTTYNLQAVSADGSAKGVSVEISFAK
ncbi:hypothetical protein [Bdellovibrio svalbardensis]|uniref:Fibronectin type-III domain-containing protein n=1 Tax=Bdellovibrio svalbardensis TaxID=2972972 RepID=A0ABT6DFQ4_9BACT|nr:hypothetical protein [Bdellovibrio svalbardensis]MDG0815334.1 hypothetical protein [Bdellovibrio svalbardensis]